jgi:hypothetical protein
MPRPNQVGVGKRSMHCLWVPHLRVRATGSSYQTLTNYLLLVDGCLQARVFIKLAVKSANFTNYTCLYEKGGVALA